MVESATDDDGNLLDFDLFKIIDQKVDLLDDGNLFPFLHSTPAFPEWPFYSGDHTAREVVEEVKDALLALEMHHQVGLRMSECAERFGDEFCDTLAVEELYPSHRCDTTKELARLAQKAAVAGSFDGFRSPRSYFELRTMQQSAGFLQDDGKGETRPTPDIRTASIHFKILII